ncbi:MAG: fibronectin type III domain-containing protein [Methanobacteriota archaeon]|nr:MAG: fibronectin type III domain-containing protein [Euryarchaeota archaeon]
MRRGGLIVFILLLFGMFNLTFTVLPENTVATTLFVGGGGPSNYTDIRSAVRNATDGDTVYVFSGTYVEQIFIDSTISMIGEDRNTTIIDVVAYDSIIFVDADWVNISGFTIRGKVNPNSTEEFINGIEMENHRNCSFTDTFFETEGNGIQLINSTGNTIMHNTFYNNSYGILFSHSYNSVIAENNFTSNKGNSIHLAYSRDNVIALNNFSSNEEDDIHLFSSSSITVYHNNLNSTLGSWDDGFNYWDSDYPSGGNHWKDYSDLDEKSGPFQDQPGSDGFGDMPVGLIGGSSKDRYPFMNATFAPSPPSPPRRLIGIDGDEMVLLSWDRPLFDGFSPITNYGIYRSTAPGQETFLTQIGNVLNYTDWNLVNGQAYYYRVTAINAVGESVGSNEISLIPFTKAGPPLNLTAQAGIEQITLTWSAPVNDGGRPVDGYVIYRENSTGGETSLVIVGNVLTRTDIGLIGGHTYFYKVAAVTLAGWGEYSTEVSATALAPPNVPPTCEITYPLPDIIVEGIVTITGTASDTDGNVQIVEIKINETAWMPATGTVSWVYEWNTTELPDENYTISARCFDGEDYSGILGLIVTVYNPPPAPEEVDDSYWLWMAFAMTILVVVLLLAALIFARRTGKKGESDDHSEEPQEEL